MKSLLDSDGLNFLHSVLGITGNIINTGLYREKMADGEYCEIMYEVEEIQND